MVLGSRKEGKCFAEAATDVMRFRECKPPLTEEPRLGSDLHNWGEVKPREKQIHR
jgi:hypothetical protein